VVRTGSCRAKISVCGPMPQTWVFLRANKPDPSMAAKDIFHNTVRTALINDGWTITHDPLRLTTGKHYTYVDLGAQKLMGADKDGRQIAVEVKSFVGNSLMNDIENAIGQYVVYLKTLKRAEPSRELYLAIPAQTYDAIEEDQLTYLFRDGLLVKLIKFDQQTQKIVEWIE
jgi:XisH protein